MIPWAFEFNGLEDLRVLLQMKANDGRFLTHEYDPKVLNRFVRRGWLIRHKDQHYQVKWDVICPLEGQYTHCRIRTEWLSDPALFKAAMFVAGCLYLMSPQVPRKPKSRPTGVRQVGGSRHNGGASHTICAPFFGKSVAWCSAMRKQATKFGLCAWLHRSVPVKPEIKRDGAARDIGLGDEIMNNVGRYFMREKVLMENVTSKIEPIADFGLHIPFEYRKSVKAAYSGGY